MDYYTITLKFIIGMLSLILQINLFGKKNLAPSSPIDQIQNFVLGGIIGGIIYNSSITVTQYIIILLLWTLIVFVVSVLKRRVRVVRRLIDGQPLTVIKNGRVLVDVCVKYGLAADEIMMNLRNQGVNDTSKVKRAYLDQNGHFEVIEYREADVRFPLISDGMVNTDVLELIKRDDQWLADQLHRQGIEDVREVYLGEYVQGKLRLVCYPTK